MRISDWSSDVCSSDLGGWGARRCLAIPGTFERKTAMRLRTIMLAGMGAIVLTACAKQEEVAAVPPPPPGAVAGSIAADRDGDGIVDGYYTAAGMYHANAVPMPPPPKSEEHTYEPRSPMGNSYDDFRWYKKIQH